ncbi:hypothetical protein GW17_00033507 [Ensete ventricosum]|nr:hypothetical protein GW17_00033507 [Ensete ventricosum]
MKLRHRAEFGRYGGISLEDSSKGSGSSLGTCQEITGRRPEDLPQVCRRLQDWQKYFEQLTRLGPTGKPPVPWCSGRLVVQTMQWDFARRLAEGTGKLAGNTPEDHWEKTGRFAASMLEAKIPFKRAKCDRILWGSIKGRGATSDGGKGTATTVGCGGVILIQHDGAAEL